MIQVIFTILQLPDRVYLFCFFPIARNLQPYPKVAIVSSQVCDKRITPYVFRSYDLPFRNYSSYNGSSKHPIWTAVRASSAAPTYFDDFLFDNKCFSDGGILANNATHIGKKHALKNWTSSLLKHLFTSCFQEVPNEILVHLCNFMKFLLQINFN